MKVIFLDVDGELTYSTYRNKDTYDIDIEKVKLLQEIVQSTNAKVVISSSWRGNNDYTPKCYYVLCDILKQYNIDIIGDTPHIDIEYDEDVSKIIAETTLEDLPFLKLKKGTGRAAEINTWLETHKNIESFVILDDEDWQWEDYELNQYWIQPNWFGDGGLQKEHVNKAINILTNTKTTI